MKKIQQILVLVIISMTSLQAQDITFTFSNAQITNDGADNFYEADIMIASNEDLYVGSGQLYIEYSTAAFGESIANTDAFEYGRPDGSILSQSFFGGFVAGYTDFVEQNNTSSRVSVSFQQNAPLGILSSQGGIITSSTPGQLFHIKLKYVNVSADPEVCFYYDDGLFQDQFITACGGAGSVDCNNFPGTQLVNDNYDCSGAALSTGTDYVYTNGWTPSDPSGQSSSTSRIEIVAGNATISANTIANDVIVRAGAGLTVNSGISLETVSGTTLESTSTAYASLISDGTLISAIAYERHVNQNASSGGNDLITPPVSGQSFTDFIANNSNIVSNAGNTLYLFGPFDKTSGTYQTYANTETVALNSGMGYRAATTDNSTLRFEGTARQAAVNQDVFNTGPNYSEWNLIGNPYPSYMNVQSFLNNVNNLSVIDVNDVGIYGYDGDASDGWVIYNLNTTDANTSITPGQGFFVAVQNNGTINFTPSMRQHDTADDFILGRDTSVNEHLRLALINSSQSYTTDFYFNANSSDGLDPGYDAAVFGHSAGEFAIYSHLVEDNNGIDMAIQSLPIDNRANTIVSLGVNADAAEQLTISIEASSLPDDVEVYLEDTEENSFIVLNSTDYVFTPTTALNGSGRFFIHFSNNILSTSENDLNTLQVYTLKIQKQIAIRGLIDQQTNAQLYDINGRLIVRNVLKASTHYNTLDTQALQSGIYILQLENSINSRAQKIIID